MKTSRIKSIQVEQFQYTLQNAAVDYTAYPIAGYAYGSVLRAPIHSSLHGFGPNQHPSWYDLAQYGPARPYKIDDRYDTSNGFAQMMDSMTCKDADNIHDSEYNNPEAFAGQYDGFAHAYFPVVFRLSPAHIKTTGIITNDYERINVVPFRVVASTWPWVNNGSPFDYSPDYRMEQLYRDGVRIDLYIDGRFMNLDEENAYLAVMGSVLSVLPNRWSGSITSDNVLSVYITIAPAISEEHFQDHIAASKQIMQSNSPNDEKCFGFSGPSLGLAVLAAIMGMPPIMYTGFNSQMGVNEILAGSNGTVQEVALGVNLVEQVDDIEYKTAAAIMIGVPIIIPINAEWYKEPSQQALYRGVARALGVNHGRQTLLALASKQFGYPANMQKAIALATDSTNWAVKMNEFIFTTAKRAAGWDFNRLPSLILAAQNLSDVQILAAHATAYMWNPTGSVLINRTKSGHFAGTRESEHFADQKHRTRRAEELAALVGHVDFESSGDTVGSKRRTGNFREKLKDGAQKSDMWDSDDLYEDNSKGIRVPPKKAAPKPKAAPKRSVGRSSGTIKPRGKAAGTKKKITKKKAAKKPKKKASKKKGGKKKAKKSKGKKKATGRAGGSILFHGTSTSKKKKKVKKPKKKKNKKGGKKKSFGRASGMKKLKKAKKSKSKLGKKKKSKSKKSYKKKIHFGRAAGSRSSRRRGLNLSAKQIMQKALAKARAGKK